MRVLYSFPHRVGVPSIGVTAWNHVAALSRLGVDVTLVCPSSERPLPDTVDIRETLRPAHLKIPLAPLGRAAYWWIDYVAESVLRRAPHGYFDIVHCWPQAGERTLRTARRLGVPSVLERPNAHPELGYDAVRTVCAELGIEVDPSSSHRWNAHTLAKEEREYQLADKLLCPSEFVRRSFMDRGYSPDRLLLTGRGYDPEQFNSHGRAVSDGQLSACFVGRGEPRKGLHYALKAWVESGAADKGGQFTIVGDIEPSYRNILQPLLSHRSVRAVGYVSDPSDIMRSSDILMLPSLDEASAKATCEARGAGCVLVVSDRASGPVRHQVDALVHRAGDVGELTEHLRLLSSDRSLLERLRGSSLDAARGETWSQAGVILREAYLRTVEDVHAPYTRREP